MDAFQIREMVEATATKHRVLIPHLPAQKSSKATTMMQQAAYIKRKRKLEFDFENNHEERYLWCLLTTAVPSSS
jgi:hypothetical protein